jgi:hypothetical protein
MSHNKVLALLLAEAGLALLLGVVVWVLFLVVRGLVLFQAVVVLGWFLEAGA